ncbi:MAG: GntR family transcriptional regulator [Victivallales bacterium]|jgi:DNA-binding LacI/PurR family transcriptional regulator
MMESLKLVRRKSMRSQISDHLRDAIRRGGLADGTMLPSTVKLAEQWGTQVANVHAAMTQLVREGLLIRQNGIGTMVNRGIEKLDTVLVYEKYYLTLPSSNFRRILLNHIREELSSRHIKCRIVYQNQSENPMAEIRELLDKRQVQGIILPSTDLTDRPLLEKLPVPFSCMTSARIKNRVSFNSRSLAEKAVEGLKRQGCKRIGLLLSVSDYASPKESGEKEVHDLINILRRKIAVSGMTTCDEWIYTADKGGTKANDDFAKYAFAGFNSIWRSKKKPNGLFAYTDDMVSGTLIALMSARVRVPEDLKLVFHRNAGHNILCPIPCCFVENSIRDIATGLVQLVVDQYYGREISHCELEYELVEQK